MRKVMKPEEPCRQGEFKAPWRPGHASKYKDKTAKKVEEAKIGWKIIVNCVQLAC